MNPPSTEDLLLRISALEKRLQALETQATPHAPVARTASAPVAPATASTPAAPSESDADENDPRILALLAAATAAYFAVEVDRIMIRVMTPSSHAWAAEGRREINRGRNLR